MLKKVLSALVLTLGLTSFAGAQTIYPTGGVDLSGNQGSPVIAVYNQSPFPVVAVTCIDPHFPVPQRMGFAHPIIANGAAQINFGKWYCPRGATIQAITADGMPHTFPWVDIHNATLLTVRW